MNGASLNTDETVECIIVQWNSCPICVQTYLDHIKPFYDKYRDNDSIIFSIIDASRPNWGYFEEEMQKINVTTDDWDDFPLVIFPYGNNLKWVLDADDLGQIESSFSTILEDIGYIPTVTLPSEKPTLGAIDFSLLLILIIFVGGIFPAILVSAYITTQKKDYRFQLKRISRNRLIVFTVLSVISIIALLYQYLDFLLGGCGCISNDTSKVLLFRQYEYIDLFGLEVPFSLLGLIIMSGILIQVYLLSILTFPMTIKVSKKRSYSLTRKHGGIWYYFIIFQLFSVVIFLFYLLYLELFVIRFICILCTLSQVIIMMNTGLILTWKPFASHQENLYKKGSNEND